MRFLPYLKHPALIALVIVSIIFAISATLLVQKNMGLNSKLGDFLKLNSDLNQVRDELTALKNQDQVKINQALEEEVKNINETYKKAITSYEKLSDLKSNSQKITDPLKLQAFDKDFASILKLLSDKNYASASAKIAELDKQLITKNEQLAASVATVTSSGSTSSTSPPVNNTAPGSGFSSQTVETDSGSFRVSIVAADLNSTRVIVDTASDGDCANECPTLPLATYVSRSGGFAGINGSFFCPPEYPSCAGKTGSFDTLLMNKNKVYFNSNNNVYSTVPAVIFSGNSARFIRTSQEWGRDTGVDAVLANHPLLVINGESAFGGSDDSKLSSRGARCFIGTTGSTVYIGIVYGATSAEAAKVLKTMGVQNALGLDQGGSTALWTNGGYRAGPGRNIPNAIVLVRK